MVLWECGFGHGGLDLVQEHLEASDVLELAAQLGLEQLSSVGATRTWCWALSEAIVSAAALVRASAMR